MKIGIAGVDDSVERIIGLCEGIHGSEFVELDGRSGMAESIDAAILLDITSSEAISLMRGPLHGKHILLPALRAASVQEIEQLYRYSYGDSGRLMIGNRLRFTPLYETVKRLVSTDELGEVGVARIVTNHSRTDASAFYGDVIRSIAQEVDLFQWCFGPAQRVYAKSIRGSSDYLQVIIRFRSGVIAYVENSLRHLEFRREIEVAGSNGLIRQASEETISLRQEIYSATNGDGTVERSNPFEEDPDETQIRHFAHAIQTGERFMIEQSDIRRSMEILDAIRESLDGGAVVSIDSLVAN